MLIDISRVIRMLRFVRILPNYFRTGDSNVNRQITTIFLTIIQLVIVSSGILLTFEAPKRLSDMANDA